METPNNRPLSSKEVLSQVDGWGIKNTGPDGSLMVSRARPALACCRAFSVLPLTAWPRWFSITPKCQPAREAKQEGRVWLALQRPDVEVKPSIPSHSHWPEQSHMATPNCKEGQEMQLSGQVHNKNPMTVDHGVNSHWDATVSVCHKHRPMNCMEYGWGPRDTAVRKPLTLRSPQTLRGDKHVNQ